MSEAEEGQGVGQIGRVGHHQAAVRVRARPRGAVHAQSNGYRWLDGRVGRRSAEGRQNQDSRAPAPTTSTSVFTARPIAPSMFRLRQAASSVYRSRPVGSGSGPPVPALVGHVPPPERVLVPVWGLPMREAVRRLGVSHSPMVERYVKMVTLGWMNRPFGVRSRKRESSSARRTAAVVTPSRSKRAATCDGVRAKSGISR